jgi:hypothetical protein
MVIYFLNLVTLIILMEQYRQLVHILLLGVLLVIKMVIL